MQIIENKYKDERSSFITSLDDLLLNQYEWDDNILKIAEKSCNFAPYYSLIIFPGGLKEVINTYIEKQDMLMLKLLQDSDLPSKIREKIALALNIRIKSFMPISHRKTASYFANPFNSAFGLKLSWRTADIIWRYVGDQSVDFNYYTKRGLLSSVYLASILFYINDKTENYIATKEFIKESIEDIIKIGSLKQKIKLPQMEDIPILRLWS